jgi:hypothetical protein
MVVSRMDFKNVVDFRQMKNKENSEEKRLGWVDAAEVNPPMEATQHKEKGAGTDSKEKVIQNTITPGEKRLVQESTGEKGFSETPPSEVKKTEGLNKEGLSLNLGITVLGGN